MRLAPRWWWKLESGRKPRIRDTVLNNSNSTRLNRFFPFELTPHRPLADDVTKVAKPFTLSCFFIPMRLSVNCVQTVVTCHCDQPLELRVRAASRPAMLRLLCCVHRPEQSSTCASSAGCFCSNQLISMSSLIPVDLLGSCFQGGSLTILVFAA